MPDNKLYELFKKHQKSFTKQLRLAKSLDEETIHKLRVAIKRLRSFYAFLETLSKHKFRKKKVLDLLRPLFKKAGEIRNLTLNIKLTKDFRSLPVSEFKTYLQEKEKSVDRKFLEQLENFDSKKFEKYNKEILKLFKKETLGANRKNSTRYIKDLFSHIQLHTEDLITDDYLHDIRKKLKDLKTISGVLVDLVPKGTLPEQEKITLLEERIGEWHDKVALVQELETFMQTAKDATDHSVTRKKTHKDLGLFVRQLKAKNQHDKKEVSGQLYLSGILPANKG